LLFIQRERIRGAALLPALFRSAALHNLQRNLPRRLDVCSPILADFAVAKIRRRTYDAANRSKKFRLMAAHS
jgi:hypothetical protein